MKEQGKFIILTKKKQYEGKCKIDSKKAVAVTTGPFTEKQIARGDIDRVLDMLLKKLEPYRKK